MWKRIIAAGLVALAACGEFSDDETNQPPNDPEGPEEEVLLAWTTESIVENGVFAWELTHDRPIYEKVYVTDFNSRLRNRVTNPRVSTDGSTLAFVDMEAEMDDPVGGTRVGFFERTVRLVRLDDGSDAALPAEPGTESFFPSLNEDGTLLAVLARPPESGAHVEAWTRAGQIVSLPNLEDGDTYPLLDSAGKTLFYRSLSSNSFLRWDLEQGTWGEPLVIHDDVEIARFPLAYDYVEKLSLSADGRWLTFFGQAPNAGIIRPFLLDTKDGSIVRIADSANDARISRDGSRLVWVEASKFGGSLYTRLRTEATPTLVARLADYDTPFAISADGGRIAFVNRPDGTSERHLVVVRPDGTDRQTVYSSAQVEITSVSF